MFVACQCNHLDVVGELLREGADIHTQMVDGATPMFIAAQNGHVKMLKYLLSKGSSTSMCRKVSTVEDLAVCYTRSRRGVQGECIWVCLSVCLSVCARNSKTIAPVDLIFKHTKKYTPGSEMMLIYMYIIQLLVLTVAHAAYARMHAYRHTHTGPHAHTHAIIYTFVSLVGVPF